jgi:hypothetical protein
VTLALEEEPEPIVFISYGVIAFTSAAPPAGTAGHPYGYTYKATGDTGITYAVTAGSLPPGLTLSATGGLTGTPTTPGTFTYTVTATGATATQARQDTVTIVAPLPAPPVPGGQAGALTLKGAVNASPTGASFSVTCTGATTCNGPAQLSTLEKLLGSKILGVSARKNKRHSSRVLVGQTAITLSAGQTQQVLVPLNATGKKLLRRFGKLPVTLTVSLASGTGFTTTATIKGKVKRRHSGSHHR